MSTYDFSTLYTTLPHNLIKQKLNDSIKWSFEREVLPYFTCSYNTEAEIIQAFNCTSRYLDDILNIDNPYFEGIVGRIFPPELQLN